MVVAFVGFVGGWTREIFGSNALFAAGLVATLVASFFTFLPSFLFIFAGAPFVETTHGNLRFTAPLSAITAAVVGVVLNLALFFAYHALWPRGFDGGLDWVAALIGALASIALLRYKTGIIPVIGVCALAGLCARLTGLA
jgi:chromate transporter